MLAHFPFNLAGVSRYDESLNLCTRGVRSPSPAPSPVQCIEVIVRIEFSRLLVTSWRFTDYGRRKHCGTCPVPTPAQGLPLLYSIPLRVNGAAGSRITRLGSPPHSGSYLSRPARFLLGRRSPAPERTTVPLRPRVLASRRRLRGSGRSCLLYHSRHRSVCSSARNERCTPDLQPTGVEASRRTALLGEMRRRAIEATRSGLSTSEHDMTTHTTTSSMPPPTLSSRRTARMGRSGSSAGTVQRSSTASPAGGPRSRTAPGPTGPRTSSSCGRFGTWGTPWSSRAMHASSPASARSSTRTGTNGGAARRHGLGRSSCRMVNAALRPLCVRSRCAGASFDRCSCHGS